MPRQEQGHEPQAYHRWGPNQAHHLWLVLVPYFPALSIWLRSHVGIFYRGTVSAGDIKIAGDVFFAAAPRAVGEKEASASPDHARSKSQYAINSLLCYLGVKKAYVCQKFCRHKKPRPDHMKKITFTAFFVVIL